MSLRKLSGAAAAGSREAYAATNNNASQVGPSKAYSSHLAIQSDAAKYRGKYKELKKKVRQIETENDKLHFKTLRIKRNIQRMRLERAILYERLEAELNTNADLTGRPEQDEVMETATTAPAAVPARQSHGFDSPAPPAHSTPARGEVAGRPRRTLDYSPSPEEDRSPVGQNGSASVDPVKPESGRTSMKVTLKRSSNATGHGEKSRDAW